MAKVALKKKEKALVKPGTYVIQPINWVGTKSQKGKPMTPRMIQGVLELYNVPKFIKYKMGLYKLGIEFKDGHLTCKVEKVQDPEAYNVKGWYNYAEEIGKRKIGVYNLCKSIREHIAKENGLEPNLIQVMVQP